MTLREILARREEIRTELRAINDKHTDGNLPAEIEQRSNDLLAEADRLNAAERRIAALDDMDRRATDARNVGETAERVWALTNEQRMADFLHTTTGARTEGLSAGRAIRGMITGRWDGAEAEHRAMGTTTGSAGGFLMPDPVSANVIDLVRNASVMVQAGVLTIPMASADLRVVKVATDPTAEWRGEGQEITESEGGFESLNLRAHSLAALVPVNNELMDDVATFAPFLDQQLAAVLAAKLDYEALNGNGVGRPLGLRNTDGVNEESMGANGAASTDFDKHLDLIQAVLEANGTPTVLIQAPRTAIKLAKIKTGIASDLTKLTPPAEYTALRRLVSNQVSITETQGSSNVASTAYIGGFSSMAFAIRQNITIEASRTGDGFKSNQTLVRAIMRADVAVFRPSQFGRLIGIL